MSPGHRCRLAGLPTCGPLRPPCSPAPVPPARLALPIQVAAVLNAASWNPYVCQGRALADAAAQQRTHAAYSLIGAARFALLPGPAAPLAPAQECAVVLSFLQLAITVAAPALAQAALEAALFAQHVAQRRAAGLPPGGTRCEGRLYSLVREAAEACDGPAALVAAWILLGILWELAVALVVGRQ